MKYDIFISYRREGGFDTAKHLYDLLTHDGYSVSFDIDTLRNGDFDTQLYTRIAQCKDFILVLDKNAFAKTTDLNCKKEHDWLRCELSYALERDLNIIPVFLEGFDSFPDNLPEDVAKVVLKNSVKYNKEYFDAFYNNIKKRFLLSRSKTAVYKTMSVVALLFLLLFCVCWFMHVKDDRIEKQEMSFMENCRLADSIVTQSYTLLQVYNAEIKGEFIEKLQNAIELYDKGLEFNIRDVEMYNSIRNKKMMLEALMDSCHSYKDVNARYFKLYQEGSIFAAAECNERKRDIVENIKNKLGSI